MVVSVRFEAETQAYTTGVDEAIQAIKDWENQTGVSSDNATQKFEDAMRAVVELGEMTGRSAEEQVRALESLTGSAEDAQDAYDAIKREASDVGREAPREMKRAEESVDDLGDAAEDAGDKTESISDKAERVGDGLRSLGDIATKVLEGDIGSAVSSAADGLGALAGAIGGGAVGGAIGVALGGIVSDWVSSWNEALQKSEERANTWADRMIDANGRVLTEELILKGVREIATGDSEAYAKALQIQAASGRPLQEVLRAMAGDGEDLTRVMDKLAEKNRQNAIVQQNHRDAGKGVNQELQQQRQEILKAQDALEKQSAEMDTGAAKARAFADAQAYGAQKTGQLGDAINDLPDQKTVWVNVRVNDQATAEADAIVDRINRKRASIGVNVYGIGGRKVV